MPRTDTERLDWLEKHCEWMKWSDMPFALPLDSYGDRRAKYVAPPRELGESMTLRSGIDLAMDAEEA